MLDDLLADRVRTIGETTRAADSAPLAPEAGTMARPLSFSATLAASAALAACGGGGGGDGAAPTSGAANQGVQAGSLTPLASTDTASGYLYTSAKTDDEAARFLLQAQGYATDADIAAVRSQGYLPWLGQQMDAAKSQTGWDWLNSKPYNTVYFDNMIWSQLMSSPDGMRKRMALALSEIFVVSGTDIGSNWADFMMAQYWDTLVAGVTTSFRALLEAITLNPAMGFYLNTKGNQKEDLKTGRQPDENYGREVMQLMTIGLYQLDTKGNIKTAADGTKLDSYTQDDVTNIARVFTGYDLDIKTAEKTGFPVPGQTYTVESKEWTQRPMVLTASRHSTLPATFLGTTIAANTDGATALKTALDTLANHANTGPFICKQLIQRLVTSNPSPDYVGRVSSVFANNGAGMKGDMKSVFAAILLDNEARSPAGLSAPNFGRLREPMLRLVQWARTFGVTSVLGTWNFGNTSDTASRLGQSPLRSPSVFNFYRPGYVPPSTEMATVGLVAPEFQIVNETTVGGYLNFMQGVIQNGFNAKDMLAAYTTEKGMVLDIPGLVDRLNLLLTGRQLSKATTDIIKTALATPALTATSTDANKLNRVCAAVLLVMGCPEYLVQK